MGYLESDLTRLGVGDNIVSSMYLPFGYAVDMFDKNDFAGEKLSVRAPFYTD